MTKHHNIYIYIEREREKEIDLDHHHLAQAPGVEACDLRRDEPITSIGTITIIMVRFIMCTSTFIMVRYIMVSLLLALALAYY